MIHLAHFWKEVVAEAEKAVQSLKNVGSVENANFLETKIETHQKKMESSGVFYLCLAMWPNVVLSKQEKITACNELEWLINKQYEKWVEWRNMISLPPDYGENDMERFILDARSELNQHLLKQTVVIRSAASKFAEDYKTIRTKLEAGGRLPRPTSKVEEKGTPYSLQNYWLNVGIELSAMGVIFIPQKSVLCRTLNQGLPFVGSTLGSRPQTRKKISLSLTRDIARAIISRHPTF